MAESQSKSIEKGASESQLVVLRVDREEYGIEIMDVREIVRWQEPTPVPQTPADVRGVISLRGTVIPVLDLRSRFGSGEPKDTTETRIVVIEVGDAPVGVTVDEVTEALSVPASAREPVSTLFVSEGSELGEVVNLEDRLLLVLDPSKLIDSVTGIVAAVAAAA